jgi:tRNA(fMet)-specific endonuclease VapC
LAFDAEAAREHARLRMALRNKPVGERNLVISSVALVHHLTIVTHNQREFSRVPGLRSMDWASRRRKARTKRNTDHRR